MRIFATLAVASCLFRSVLGQSLADPLVAWSVKLPESTNPTAGLSNLVDGNAVTLSPDGTLLYVTLSDGRLQVLDPSDGSTMFDYQPEPANAGWGLRCSSGVYFGELGTIGAVAIYGIVDIPPPGVNSDSQS